MELNEFLSRLESNPVDSTWNRKSASEELPPILANNSNVVKYYTKAASELSDETKEHLENTALFDAVKILYGNNQKAASERVNIIKSQLKSRLDEN